MIRLSAHGSIVIALDAGPAFANQCPIYKPWVANLHAPLGCRAGVCAHPSMATTTVALRAKRGLQTIDITGTVAHAVRSLPGTVTDARAERTPSR